MQEFLDTFQPMLLSRDWLRMRSHFAHSTPVGRPFTWSGQAPIVVPCSMLALVGIEAG